MDASQLDTICGPNKLHVLFTVFGRCESNIENECHLVLACDHAQDSWLAANLFVARGCWQMGECK